MSFNRQNLSIPQERLVGSRHYQRDNINCAIIPYTTTDNLSSVSLDGYFDAASEDLIPGDFILVSIVDNMNPLLRTTTQGFIVQIVSK